MIARPLTIHPLLHIVEHLRARDREEVLCLRQGLDLVEWANEAVDLPGNHFVFASDQGEPIAAGGWIALPQRHVVSSWLVATDRIRAIGDGLHRFAVRGHATLAAAGVRRFQTLCLGDDGAQASTARRWLTRLGYGIEGVMRDLGVHGEDLVMLARRA